MGGATTDIDLTRPELYAAGVPHEVFAELRAAGGVHRHRAVELGGIPTGEFWSVVGHAEIQQANRDWETFTASESVSIHRGDPSRHSHTLVSMDPPDHTRLRRLITAG